MAQEFQYAASEGSLSARLNEESLTPPLAQLGDCLRQRCAAWNAFGPRGSGYLEGQPAESPEDAASFVSNSSTEDLSPECHLTPGSILSGIFGHRPALEVRSHRSHEFRAMRCFERCCRYDFRRRSHFPEQVVYAGFVVKCSRHLGRWRQRWAVLTPSCLKTFKEQQLCAKPTEDFQLQQVKHVAVQGSEVMLDLQNHRCTFRCPGPNVADAWAFHIRMCCERARA